MNNERHLADLSAKRAEIQLELNSLKGAHILLLEDEPLIALEVEDLCRENGAHSVITHSDYEQAETALQQPFDIVVIDLILRGKSALPLADMALAANTPIVFTTGGDEGQLRSRFPDAPLVRKPYTSIELIDAMRSVRRASSGS